MDELEAKLRIFEAIANNCDSLSDTGRFMTPSGAAKAANDVYKILTEG